MGISSKFLVTVSFLLVFPIMAAPPTESPDDLRFLSQTEAVWSPVAGASSYHVYEGSNPSIADSRCYRFGVTDTSVDILETPLPGELQYYLVSAVNQDGESPFGPDSSGVARTNPAPCIDSDGDLQADNLDNCPNVSNASQADQDLNQVGDRCDPQTYDFEDDVVGNRPLGMVALGGATSSLTVATVQGEQAVRFSADEGRQDRFDALSAEGSFIDTTLYVDVENISEAASFELWSDGAFAWRAGSGIIVQIDSAGQLVFYERIQNNVGTGTPGPLVPLDGRLRFRILKGSGNLSEIHVDILSGEEWSESYATYSIADDHRFIGRAVAMADYGSGLRSLYRATVQHEVPDGLLTIKKAPSWSTDWKLFQRDSNDVAAIPVRVFHRMTAAGQMQARVVNSANGVVLPGFDWVDHATAVAPAPMGGEAELTLSQVPAGGNYDVEVRLVRDSDGVVVAESSIVELAVGDLWISGGQSNMAGYSGALVNPEAPVDRVHLFGNDNQWKRATEPMDSGVNQVDGVSAENPAHSLMLRFAKEMELATGIPQGVIPGPLGGTNLFNQWQRNELDHDDRGTLYGSLLHRWILQNETEPPFGFIWFQGESDVGRSSDQYEADMNDLIAKYREDFGNPDLYVLQAQIGISTLATDLEAWVSIQEAQRRVAEADPKVAVIPTVDQPLSDTIHFNEEGYKTIGVRFAEAAREMIYGEPLDASLRVINARRVGNGRSLEIEFDGDISGGETGLFRVREGLISVGIKSISTSGNVLTLQLDARLTDPATVSYGYSNSTNRNWVRDTRGTPVPHFREFPVD